MAVASISSWKAAPGRRKEFIERLSQARKFHEKYGGRVRIWNHSVAGDDVGTIDYWIEHADFEAYGRFYAALANDTENKQWFQKFTEDDPSGRVVATRLMQDIG